MDYITLNNGLKMPLLGFGTMNIFDEEECTKILKEAYEEVGVGGHFGLYFINELIDRLDKGERTQELYDEIMESK